MGTGLVEPIDNWGRNPPVSHPDVLNYLVEQFQASGYSVRRIEELILKSDAYQRKRVPALSAKKSERLALFAAQPERRMRAEELVDSLHRAVRREFKSERMSYSSVDYGFPKRTWQLVTLSNEEDNAILVRPLLQEILTTASSFGLSGAAGATGIGRSMFRSWLSRSSSRFGKTLKPTPGPTGGLLPASSARQAGAGSWSPSRSETNRGSGRTRILAASFRRWQRASVPVIRH
jgi:hypothetical protein